MYTITLTVNLDDNILTELAHLKDLGQLSDMDEITCTVRTPVTPLDN